MQELLEPGIAKSAIEASVSAPESALRMLGYDAHAGHYELPAGHRRVSSDRPKLRQMALGLLAADSSAKNTFAKIAADRTDDPVARSTSAVALQALAPKEFNTLARTIVADEDDDDGVRATVLTALTHDQKRTANCIATLYAAVDVVDVVRTIGASEASSAQLKAGSPRLSGAARLLRVGSVAVHVVADLGELLASIREDPGRRIELIPLLHEGAAIYVDRGSSACGRIRARILATFGEVGLPATALPIVIEALCTELNPEIVAGAAIAARGLAGSHGELSTGAGAGVGQSAWSRCPGGGAQRPGKNPPHCWRSWPRCAGNRASPRTWSTRSECSMIDIQAAGAFRSAAPLSRRSPSWQLARGRSSLATR